jgi:hypothetical protein
MRASSRIPKLETIRHALSTLERATCQSHASRRDGFMTGDRDTNCCYVLRRICAARVCPPYDRQLRFTTSIFASWTFCPDGLPNALLATTVAWSVHSTSSGAGVGGTLTPEPQ